MKWSASKEPATLTRERSIVFYDGVCNLCNGFVDFLIRHDKNDSLLFSPLQGETFSESYGAGKIQSFDSVVFASHGRLYFKAQAVIQIMANLGGIWRLAEIFLVFPDFLLNPIYDLVAKNRIRWFGQKSSCRIPTAAEKAKFLS